MKLLIIRPQPGATATAQRAKDMGLAPVIMPLFTVVPLKWEPPKTAKYDALLITSANAIRHGGDGLASLRSLPVYAVGKTSADAAREAGFVIAAAGSTDAAAMLEMVQEQGCKNLLWLTGADHIELQPQRGVNLEHLIAYQSEKLLAPDGFAKLLSEPTMAMLHSPRAARHFAALCDEGRIDCAQISLAALSANIAEAAGPGWKNKIIADQPSDTALLARLATCFTNIPSAPY